MSHRLENLDGRGNQSQGIYCSGTFISSQNVSLQRSLNQKGPNQSTARQVAPATQMEHSDFIHSFTTHSVCGETKVRTCVFWKLRAE